MNKIFKVGLIGCGHISETYFRAEKYFNNIKIVKCADINLINAKKCAQINKIKATTVKKLLEDKEIEIILNLTIPKAHYQVAKQALTNGKHVYSEKPLAINFKDGQELLKLSKKKKLYIGNAPDTFLGGGIQKSKELIDKKMIGKINLGNAIFAFPGVQSYHPNPEPWFAKKVTGSIVNGVKRRTIGIGPRKNKKFKVECPTTYLSTITFQNGTVIRLTLSFDVIAHQRNHIELYGDKGSMIVPDPNMFGGSVFVCKNLGDTWSEYKTNKMPLGKINIRSQSSRANESATNANYRGAGLAEMAYSIENKKVNKCNGELSLHVLDIIQSTMKACKTGIVQSIKTTCKKPQAFTLKEIKKIIN